MKQGNSPGSSANGYAVGSRVAVRIPSSPENQRMALRSGSSGTSRAAFLRDGHPVHFDVRRLRGIVQSGCRIRGPQAACRACSQEVLDATRLARISGRFGGCIIAIALSPYRMKPFAK